MATLQALVEPLLPLAPMAPEAAFIYHYRRAAQDFFTRTQAWREEVEFEAAAGADQAFAPSSGLAIDVAQCWYGDQQLKRMTDMQYRRDYGTTDPTDPVGYTVDGTNTLRLLPGAPEAGETIRVLAVIKPSDAATSIADSVALRYGWVIEYGALSRLYRVPQKPWTDYKLAQANMDLYEHEVDRHWALGPDGGVGTPRRVRYGGIR